MAGPGKEQWRLDDGNRRHVFPVGNVHTVVRLGRRVGCRLSRNLDWYSHIF